MREPTPASSDVRTCTRRAERLTGLFEGGVVGVELCGPASAEWLLPEEAPFVERAVEKRVLEFAAGRACARLALEQLGVKDFPLRVGEKRFPVWPGAAVGSITHTTSYCGAVACLREHYPGIGVDVEQRGRLERKLERMICTEAERHWLDGLVPEARADMATVVFSAKEAFYKAQFCVTGAWLGFHDVTLEIDREAGIFEVTVHEPLEQLEARRGRMRGRFVVSADHVSTGIALTPI